MTQTWYCPLPFRSVFVESNGISPCCQIPRQPMNLEDWSNSSWLNNLQQQFLAGEKPEVCGGCINSEQYTGRSLRTDAVQ